MHIKIYFPGSGASKTIVSLSPPPNIFVVTIIIFIITALFCRNKKKILRKMVSEEERELYKKTEPTFCTFFIAWEKTAIVVGTFLSWPTVVQKILEVMNCEKIGDKYCLLLASTLVGISAILSLIIFYKVLNEDYFSNKLFFNWITYYI